MRLKMAMLGLVALAMVVALSATADSKKANVVLSSLPTVSNGPARDVSTIVKDQRVGVFPLRDLEQPNRFDANKLVVEWTPKVPEHTSRAVTDTLEHFAGVTGYSHFGGTESNCHDGVHSCSSGLTCVSSKVPLIALSEERENHRVLYRDYRLEATRQRTYGGSTLFSRLHRHTGFLVRG